MDHRWDTLSFLHWRYDPAVVQALLPPGLRVEVRDGSVWVALVPFALEITRPDRPPVPWASHFAETNVRTYVTAPDGTTGVWFLSLDAALPRCGARRVCWVRAPVLLVEDGGRSRRDVVTVP